MFTTLTPSIRQGVQRYLTPKNTDLLARWADQMFDRPFDQSILDFYRNVMQATDDETVAALGIIDRYFLLVGLCKRHDMRHPFVYERCREVQADPDGHLDLWAREHYKSTIITFGGIMQEVLADPELTVGIFSYNSPKAKTFLDHIKREWEDNDVMKIAYSDVLWEWPQRQAPRWSLDRGLIVKRKTNPREATIEAHGMVDSQPTGAHYRLMVYDDVVVWPESVLTPEAIEKTTDAWSLSLNLSAEDR